VISERAAFVWITSFGSRALARPFLKRRELPDVFGCRYRLFRNPLDPPRLIACESLAADRRPGSSSAMIYSISSSARTSNEGGMVIPRALAVLRLITNSSLVGC
jgi:hypothetical protein